MKYPRILALMSFAVVLAAGLWSAAFGQANDGNLANAISGGSSIRFEVLGQHAGGTLTITAPDGRAFSKDFHAGASPEFIFTDKQGLPDGTYTYELRLQPSLTGAQRAALKAARGKDDDPESERAGRRRSAVAGLVQSGSFAVVNGQIIVAGLSENTRSAKAIVQPSGAGTVTSANTLRRLRSHRLSLGALPDQVIADDLIVQGSLCVGSDCVNNENFGFDTIRLKENNDRIQFDDTSVSAGFATNNWQIRANSSASGGGNFLAFVDQGTTANSETGTIVFEVDAGAPANSLRVSSAGKVGIRTATPVLDLHINNTDTPAMRLEQNNSGGFTAQTWDIAGNEANFFVRDVTGGSRLPFRIRPGAPTSSIDVNAAGNVGIGTASPSEKLHVFLASGNVFQLIESGGTGAAGQIYRRSGATDWVVGQGAVSASSNYEIGSNGSADALWNMNGAQRMVIKGNTGNVGIATAAPTDTLSVNGTASKPGGGSWSVFSDERLKNIKGQFKPGLSAVMRLQPLRYQYKDNNPLSLESGKEYVGFGAKELQKVLPEAVSTNANGYLQVNNDPILWTMLNAIKEQQKEIEQLKGQIRKLQANSHRRRK